jgi:hypothetical protein
MPEGAAEGQDLQFRVTAPASEGKPGREATPRVNASGSPEHGTGSLEAHKVMPSLFFKTYGGDFLR